MKVKHRRQVESKVWQFPCEEGEKMAKWWEIRNKLFRLVVGRRRVYFYPFHVISRPCVSALQAKSG